MDCRLSHFGTESLFGHIQRFAILYRRYGQHTIASPPPLLSSCVRPKAFLRFIDIGTTRHSYSRIEFPTNRQLWPITESSNRKHDQNGVGQRKCTLFYGMIANQTALILKRSSPEQPRIAPSWPMSSLVKTHRKTLRGVYTLNDHIPSAPYFARTLLLIFVLRSRLDYTPLAPALGRCSVMHRQRRHPSLITPRC